MDGLADEPDPDAARLGQITCFVVARNHRRTGVARALLEAACDMLRQQGLAIAEAHPSRKAASDAANHYGPLALFQSAGFTAVRERDDGIVVMRRVLR